MAEKQPTQVSNAVPTQVNVDELLKQLQVEELLEKKRAKAEAEESNRKMRDSVIEQVKQAEQYKINAQRACSHEKPNKMPNLNGQKDHQGVYHLVCSACQKHFTQHTCPPDLWQKLNFDVIGGPQQ